MARSRFLIAFLLFFIVGIFFGDLANFDLWWSGGILIGIILALIIWWEKIYWRFVLFILIGLILGLGYGRFWDNRQKSLVLSGSQEVSFEGQIVGHPDTLANQSRYLIVYRNYKIQVSTGRYPEYHYGDILKIKGNLQKPNDYLFHQGVLGVIYQPELIEKKGASGNFFSYSLYQMRDKFEETLDKILNEPYASFAAGLTLGSKRNIPDSLMLDFNRTGTTHIVAVSGYNVTIIITYIGLFLGIFSRKLRFWGSLLAILGFVVTTGAPASVVRAGILAGLIAFGQYEGRRINMTILLLLVAFLMLLFNPYALKFDLSFQLSFLAFAGLVYLSPIIANFKIVKILPGIWRSSFSETMGAQIFVLPILIYHFGRLSLISPLVNILILWIIPTTMMLIFLMGLVGLVWFSLGEIIGSIGWLFLKYIIVVIESFGKISWASSEIKTSEWWWIVFFYGLLVLGMDWLKKMTNRQRESNEQS